MGLAFANGQLAAAAGTILAGSSLPANGANIDIAIHNTGANTETVVLTVLRQGGTARRVKRALLAANESMLIANYSMDAGDTLQGTTTNADVVDYDIKLSTGGAFSAQVFDANGNPKAGTGGISGAQTFDGDVTLKSNSGTSNVVWDQSTVDNLWANAPSKLHPGFHQIAYEVYDDFMYPASATASDVMAWTRTTGAGGTDAFQDAAGGWLNVVTAAADNDHVAWSSVNEVFLFAEGKKLWFEICFKLAEATTNESAWWAGLTDTLTTGGFQANALGPLASYDGALIWKDEGTMLIDFETSNAGTQATTTNMATFVTNTETRVGFYFDGTATTSVITPYYSVDGSAALVAGTSQEITLAGLQEMHLVFGVKAGPTAAAETLQVNWVRAVQLR